MSYFLQSAHTIRLEWGAAAVRHLGSDSTCVIIIDVMSFATCVSIAVERGACVYPYPARDATAKHYAEQRSAVLASHERRSAGAYSLSPASLLTAPAGLQLVLPSPNGAALAWQARAQGATVFCGCLRNRLATAAACRGFASILVVPCGERWPDQSLRPSLEDYVAAGGIIAAFDLPNLSPEARAAASVYDGLGTQRSSVLRSCSSALELLERGFAEDVELCLAEDVSSVACRLEQGAFIPA